MKKLILVFGFCVISISIQLSLNTSAFASLSPIGSANNPVNIYIQPSPYPAGLTAQLTRLNLQSEVDLKNKYGEKNFIACYSPANGCDFTTKDINNPDNVTSCLVAVESCLKRAQTAKEISSLNLTAVSDGCVNDGGIIKCNCTNGDVLSSDGRSCITPTLTNAQVCLRDVGENTIWDGTKDSNGNITCVCKNGYTWKAQGQGKGCTAVSVAPVKTNDQQCQDSYGINSVWSGTSNSDGTLVCDCKNNYEWNQSQTQCISIPKKTTPSRRRVIKIESNISTSSDIGVVKDPKQLEIKLSTSTEPIKSVGFWSRVKSWFGFR